MITPRHAILPLAVGASLLLCVRGGPDSASTPTSSASATPTRTPAASETPSRPRRPTCCRRLREQGLADLIAGADELLRGRVPTLPPAAATGPVRVELVPTEVYHASQERLSDLSARALQFEGLDPHARPGAEALWAIARVDGGWIPTAVVALEPGDFALVKPIITRFAALDRVVRAERGSDEASAKLAGELATLAERGSPAARRLAGLDFLDDARLTPALTADAIAALGRAIAATPDSDPTLAELVGVLACRPDSEQARTTLLAQLERERFDKVFDTFVRALRRNTMPELITDLGGRISPERPLVVRRRAAALVARSDDPRRLDLLAAWLDNRADKELQAAALIGFAGVTRHEAAPRARRLALDVLRLHVLPAPRRADKGPAAERLAERRRDELRAKGGSEETLRLMAAGHLLVRLPDASLRKALERWLPRLDDPAVEAFIRTRRAEAWSEFDGAW